MILDVLVRCGGVISEVARHRQDIIDTGTVGIGAQEVFVGIEIGDDVGAVVDIVFNDGSSCTGDLSSGRIAGVIQPQIKIPSEARDRRK